MHLWCFRAAIAWVTGERFERGAAQCHGAGAFLAVQPNLPHYSWSEGVSVVQIEAQGPMTTTDADGNRRRAGGECASAPTRKEVAVARPRPFARRSRPAHDAAARTAEPPVLRRTKSRRAAGATVTPLPDAPARAGQAGDSGTRSHEGHEGQAAPPPPPPPPIRPARARPRLRLRVRGARPGPGARARARRAQRLARVRAGAELARAQSIA
jgi:hypothetical protein